VRYAFCRRVSLLLHQKLDTRL
jgi:hypothetical protein